MNPVKQRAGFRYGRLVAIKEYGRTGHNVVLWLCKCDCGKEVIVRGSNLQSGKTTSCGCYRDELRTKHGDTTWRGFRSRLYRTWQNMIQRCENPNSTCYERYGGRGVSVCESWHDYTVFKTWAMSNGYNDSLQIDRVNFNGNYDPSNCHFVEPEENARNKRNIVKISLNGQTLCAAEWARKTGIPAATICFHAKNFGTSEAAEYIKNRGGL